MHCTCFIVPQSVLERFSKDKDLTSEERKAFVMALDHHKRIQRMRYEHTRMTLVSPNFAALLEDQVEPPALAAYDCGHGQALPGKLLSAPYSDSAARAIEEATGVVRFYQEVFGRNSVDNRGADLISSVHYGVRYNNAFWNGSQMAYGDGDGKIFIDFTMGIDVIGHELTHGVTQYTTRLNYQDEPGGLNESISDVFGIMYRQWRSNPQQNAEDSNWLIGNDILGPKALAAGYTCLRDLSDPGAAHCLSPQPSHYSDYHDGMDPHESSGIPNFAFYKAATQLGGASWEKAGKVWYGAITMGASPNMTMAQFADRTRKKATALFPQDQAVFDAVDQAWKAVGL